MASGDVIKTKVDYWGRERKVVSYDDWILVRPIAKEVSWSISEAINYPGVERVFFGLERHTRFAMPKDSEEGFRQAGKERAELLKANREKRIRQDTAYQKRVEKQKKMSVIYAAHRKECAAALSIYNTECNQADNLYHNAKGLAAKELHATKEVALADYKVSLDEADEDRDEAFEKLQDD